MSTQKSIAIDINELCSSGSFADVYIGKLNRGTAKETIAIKVLKEKWLKDQDQIHRFWDEAELIKKLNHQHIIKVEGVVYLNGLPSIVMEYVDGFDIKNLLKHPQFLFSPKASLEMAAIVAKTLNDVYNQSSNTQGHSLAVIHRDIKPSNIMLNRTGLVRILDFGASRFNDEDRLGKTSLYEPGSQKYSPPDRRLGNRGTHTGDIYALGLILIEMLLNKILPTPPIDPAEHQQYITNAVAAIHFDLPNSEWESSAKDTLIRMCSFDPERRLNAEQAVHMLTPYAQNARGLALGELIQQKLLSIHKRNTTGQLTGKSTQVQFIKSLHGKENKPEPVEEDNKPTTTKSTKSNPNASFWKNFSLYGGIVFLALHVVTFGALSAFSESENPTEKVPQIQQEKKATVTVSVRKSNIAKLKITDQQENVVLKLPRSKKSESLRLPTGEYSISIRELNTSTEEIQFQMQIEETTSLICEYKDKKSSCTVNGKPL
jgi:serine/threonine protein kinase